MIDFVKLATKYRIPYLDESGHHHAANGWVQTHCPWCAGSRGGWHLGFSKVSGTFNCWRCGKTEFKKTLKMLLKCSDDQLSGMIKQYSIKRYTETKKEIIRTKTVLPPPGTGVMGKQHRKYLRGRGFDPEKLETEWNLLGTTMLSGSWNWRVIYPIRDRAGNTVAYHGRSIGDAKPKYKMTDSVDCSAEPSSFIYGIEAASSSTIIIVEGAPGVWRLGPGAVALLGIDWKPEQANILRQYKRRFVLFDPEPQAQKRANELAEHLSLFQGETEVLSGFETDPGDFDAAEVRRIRRDLCMT